MSERLVFIDWMKVLGMYLIVLGHILSVNYEYIYVISVPLFFIISGFLEKSNQEFHDFLRKMIDNLIIPMLLITFILFILKSIPLLISGQISTSYISKFLVDVVLGNQSALKAFWFVYTLCFIKIIFYCISSIGYTKQIAFTISAIGLAIAYFLDVKGIEIKNSIVNICVCFPFFSIGYLLQKYRKYIIQSYDNKYLMKYLILVGILMILFIGYYNGAPWMYMNKFGNNPLLFIFGGTIGCLFIFGVSILFGRNDNKIVMLLSSGTIIILGFHDVFLHFIRVFFRDYPNFHHVIIEYIYSFLVLLLFYPIIIVIKSCFPILLGKRKC